MNAASVTALLLCLGFASISRAADAPKAKESSKSDSWVALFDGTSTRGWRGFGKPSFPEQGWTVKDGWLTHVAKGGGGDIITDRLFTDFELRFEWRISAGGNSGVKYFIDEARKAAIGHEYQIIDDAAHPDAHVGPKRQTAALYDALPAGSPKVKPAGQINESAIVVKGDAVEHWLNGDCVLKYRIGSPELAAAKAASKFKNEAKWGTRFPTPILLQDHSDAVEFRSIRIRQLN
ncbi:MAG: DUF1080 domain-containing protein [Verrucomicrobiota bacterium]